jgi:hypothetical protein
LFWTTYQCFRRGQSLKSGDFDQNTKYALKSSVLGLIDREKAQNDGNKISQTILRKNIFHGLKPSDDSISCDHFAMVTWEFFVRMFAIGNILYEDFFVHLCYMYVLSKKNLNAFIGSRDYTGI